MPGSGLLSRDTMMGETLSSQGGFVSRYVWECEKGELIDASALKP